MAGISAEPDAHGVEDLPLALQAVLDEGVDVALRLRRSTARASASTCGRRPPGDLAQRVDVGGHVAVGRRDDGRAPAHHVVAGEQHALLGEGEAHVVRRVPGRVHAA